MFLSEVALTLLVRPQVSEVLTSFESVFPRSIIHMSGKLILSVVHTSQCLAAMYLFMWVLSVLIA